MSWWGWALIAWLLASVAFAVLMGKFIAVGRARGDAPPGPVEPAEAELLIDLTGPEPTVTVTVGFSPAPASTVVPSTPGSGPGTDRGAPGSEPARSV